MILSLTGSSDAGRVERSNVRVNVRAVLSATVTVHCAVKPPSTVVTVITAVPRAFAVTCPVSSTSATAGSEEDHVTSGKCASAGATVAVRGILASGARVISVTLRVTPVTAIRLTVTTHVPVFPPSTEVAVMVTVPSLRPSILPFSSTVAISGSDVDHVTSFTRESSGSTTGSRVIFSPMNISLSDGLKVTAST